MPVPAHARDLPAGEQLDKARCQDDEDQRLEDRLEERR